MIIRLHFQVTATPKIRAPLQVSEEPVSILAKYYDIYELIVTK